MRDINLTREHELTLLDGMLYSLQQEEKRSIQTKQLAEEIAIRLGVGIDWNSYSRNDQSCFEVTIGQKWTNKEYPTIGAVVKNCEKLDAIKVTILLMGIPSSSTQLSLDTLKHNFTLAYDPRSYKRKA